MDIVHITLTAENNSRLPLFPAEAHYHGALHRLGRICQGCLALFALVSEHLHLVALCSRVAAGRLAQRSLATLRPLVATALAPSHIGAVETRSHMRWLLRYMLSQPVKHGMPGHPATWVGSCFPDLVGARVLPGLELRIHEALPDYTQRAALDIVGLTAQKVRPANRSLLRAVGAHRLVAATAAALGVDPALAGNAPAARLARRAVAQLAARVGVAPCEVAGALGRAPKTLWRLRKRSVEQDLLLIIARRVTLDELVRHSAMQTATPLAR